MLSTRKFFYVDHVRDMACSFISPLSDLIRHIPATSAVKHRITELPISGAYREGNSVLEPDVGHA